MAAAFGGDYEKCLWKARPGLIVCSLEFGDRGLEDAYGQLIGPLLINGVGLRIAGRGCPVDEREAVLSFYYSLHKGIITRAGINSRAVLQTNGCSPISGGQPILPPQIQFPYPTNDHDFSRMWVELQK